MTINPQNADSNRQVFIRGEFHLGTCSTKEFIGARLSLAILNRLFNETFELCTGCMPIWSLCCLVPGIGEEMDSSSITVVEDAMT
jgi:hypothetical protein